MRLYVCVTDNDWFNFLKDSEYREINFWRPGGRTGFRALNKGEILLFKLHYPLNYIVGGGFFLDYLCLPASVAWDAYGTANGMRSSADFYNRIYHYRGTRYQDDPNPEIGCIMLSDPFYFPRAKWIEIPSDWNRNIVQGKTYDTENAIGKQLFERVKDSFLDSLNLKNYTDIEIEETVEQRFGKEQIITPRLGQSSFMVMVLNAYGRKCAITGEKTLPVLQAAHIRPYSQEGPHSLGNGLSLRSDFHALFDRGYITIDRDYRILVSKSIKEEFGNGREYYAYHGQSLSVLPDMLDHRPQFEFLEWHNEKVYTG